MRKIIHCDADCFFAAIEMRDDPRLRHRPIAVGGRSDQRGVISTCNYEARRFGVHSAMASAQAMRLCPDLVLLPHRMEIYRQVSQGMRQIFYRYSDLVEPLSLDEAYIDVSDSPYYSGSATRIAEAIRADVKKELGITLSAGVAPNKFLAKIASDWRKPDGLTVITPDQVDDFVAKLPVHKIHGVGRATAARLHALGIDTCADLRTWDVFTLSARFGTLGPRLHTLSYGVDEREVTSSRRRKSMSVEHTWPQDLPDVTACLEALPELLMELKSRLRRLDDGYLVVKHFVKVKFADFTQTTLERMGNSLSLTDYQALCAEAHERGRGGVRLLGVGVRFVDLSEDKAFHQLDLFA